MPCRPVSAFALALLLSASACVVGDPSTDPLTSTAAPAPNRLLADSDLEGGGDLDADDVQRLLLYHGSALATYTEDGRSAAAWIADAGHAAGISPLYLVARIETESGLVRSGHLGHLASATGCACPDGVACDPAFAGFGMQTRCAAELMRGYLDDLDTLGHTISGWRVGVGRSTLDPCFVTPANRATAALYTYTPWVGAYAEGCGTPQWGGSSLVARLHRMFADDLASLGECVLGDGDYCGGNGVDGDPATLYRCTGGVAAPIETCAAGCERKAAGENDVCLAACAFGDGSYCGGNGVGGDADTLYHCTDGSAEPIEVCAAGCEWMPTGHPDRCR